MKTISRSDAQKAGYSRYFTNKPCVNGHVAERYTNTGVCLGCKHVHTKNRQRRLRATNEPYNFANRARVKAWRLANPERYKASQKRWREQNPDYEGNWENWKQRNPDRVKAANRTKDIVRKARKKSAPGNITTEETRVVIARARGRCAGCGKRRKRMDIDHIVPLARGGTNDARNLQMLCPTCNRRKAHKDPLTWAAENGRLV